MSTIIRIIDTETTGFDPKVDKVVEIASIDIDLEKRVFKNPINILVNPGCPIPATSSAVHGIIDEDVKDKDDFNNVISRFAGADFYAAHNAKFDRQFLPFEDKDWICTMKCAARIWEDAPSYSNQVLRYWRGHVNPLGINRKEINPHRAISDVYVTGAIFSDLIKEASIGQLVEWSTQPMLIRTFPFGKHKGQKLSDIPVDYLEWVVGSNLDDDIKWNASEEINRRAGGVK